MHSTDQSLLRIRDLDVYYGQAHALQGVSLSLGAGVLAVVGRNGMGKSTLCKAITGLVRASGSIQFAGRELLGLEPHVITRLGVAYVPQGRRVWRSLTVDETLRLAARTARQGAWTVERVYQVFPRLRERRQNGGAQLSGGEQQMLAIGRALLFNPSLLVMDEPTEGLAPVIVEQVATLLKTLADERSMSVLLIEQNLGVALEVADDVAIMVNGRIAHQVPSHELASDRSLQQRLLGLKAGAADAGEEDMPAPVAPPANVRRLVRAFGGTEATATVFSPQVREPMPPAIYLAGDWAAQGAELMHARQSIESLGERVVTVDLSGTTSSHADVDAREISRHRPLQTRDTDFMDAAFPAYLATRTDLAGLLVLARGSSGSAGCAGAQSLPMGVPKIVLTDRPLPGTAADVMVMTVPLSGLNRLNEELLTNSAAAMVAMLRASRPGAHQKRAMPKAA